MANSALPTVFSLRIEEVTSKDGLTPSLTIFHLFDHEWVYLCSSYTLDELLFKMYRRLQSCLAGRDHIPSLGLTPYELSFRHYQTKAINNYRNLR